MFRREEFKSKSSRQKKNKNNFKIAVRVPQVVSSDVRRFYTTMWSNVFNLYDPKLLVKFVDKYSRPDVVLHKAFPQGGEGLINFPSNIKLHGKQTVALYWASILQLSPDQVVLHDKVSIEPRNDAPGSAIRCRLRVRGSRPYDVTLEDLMSQLTDAVHHMAVDQTEGVGLSSAENGTSCSQTGLGSAVQNTNYSDDVSIFSSQQMEIISSVPLRTRQGLLPLLDSPGPLYISGIFTFYLDSDKYIEKMDYNLFPEASPISFFEDD